MLCKILHTVYNLKHSVKFYNYFTLRCFVARRLLSRIYALSSVKFPDLKLRLCEKETNMRYEWATTKCQHIKTMLLPGFPLLGQSTASATLNQHEGGFFGR